MCIEIVLEKCKANSLDKSVIVWHLTRDESSYGVPRKALRGHNHFVQDVVISSDGQFALSASWDKTLRLWDLNTGTTTRQFVGHTNDVLSVSFSADNRQIVSGSRDRTIKLWNTLGECKMNMTEDGHTEWISCVRFSPNPSNPVIVSAGWDKYVKVCITCPVRWMMHRLYLLLQRSLTNETIFHLRLTSCARLKLCQDNVLTYRSGI